jgi:hypothetical protein
MTEIKWRGKEDYHGWDGDQTVTIESGETGEVSEEKAEQMLADFPKQAELVKQKNEKPPKENPPA